MPSISSAKVSGGNTGPPRENGFLGIVNSSSGGYRNTVTLADMTTQRQRKSDQGYEMNDKQCRMARAATGMGVRNLAKAAGVSPDTIARLERGEQMRPATIDVIRAALENAGVEFIAENGGGAGVRLKKDIQSGERP
jgi:DNA-binding XRE family transcriptional regulator